MATTSRKPVSKKTKTTRKVSAASTRKSTTKKLAPKKKTTKAVATSKTTAVKKSTVRSAGSAVNESLRKLNLFVAFASAVQAALILWMSKAFGGIASVATSFTTNDSLATASTGQNQIVTASHRLFDMHLSWMLAAVLITSGLAHLAAATILRKRYEREVGMNVNRVRWATYAVSGSLLLITVALAAGISDLVTLLSIAGFTVIASLVSLSREHYTQNGERTRLVYGIGAIAGAGPWIILLINVLGTHQYGTGGTPKYMYWIYFTGLVLVTALARNLRMQTKQAGRWIDYVYAERVYIWLCLIGNAAITWQIYAALLKK